MSDSEPIIHVAPPLPWLSDLELHNLTHRRRAAAQARVLTDWGIAFRTRPDGSLLVMRTALDSTPQPTAGTQQPASSGIRWSQPA